jgi:hypothetical protein
MAKGWESKSVEEQQITQQEAMDASALTADKEQLARVNAEVQRKVQALTMTRARICEQLTRTSNERYTLLLNTELQQIDGELAKLV